MTVHHTVPDSSAADPVRLPVEHRSETPRAAGFAGLAFAVLFVGSIVLLRGGPSTGSTAAEIQSFYLRTDSGSVALVGVYLAPFSGIAFLWFIAAGT